MIDEDIINKLKEYKKVLRNYFEIDSLYLFGSYARNNFNEYSDIDVAIVVDKIKWDFSYYAPLIWKLRINIDDRIEPVMLENQNDPSGFLEEIKRTGILIN